MRLAYAVPFVEGGGEGGVAGGEGGVDLRVVGYAHGEEHGDYERSVGGVPVGGELGGCEGGVAF